MKLWIGVFLLVFVGFSAWAAPHPATTSSALTDPEKGHAFRAFGFNLSLDKLSWRPLARESESLFTEVQFQSKTGKNSEKAQISLRMDELTRTQNIESYAKKWMRDYPHYGFEVLGTKTFSHSGGQGLVVDLFHRQNNKQLRQVILLKNKRVAILTCSHEKSKFSDLLSECNQLVKSFSWID